MKNTAIIAEYNPFHNGHKYQIDKIKSTNSNIVVIMSSSFTQRGIPAITDKFSRAKTAVLCGADLVIELPGVFSTSNAEIFAKGAVGILNQMEIIDYLCFGSENSLEQLNNILNKIEENKNTSEDLLKKYLSLGFAYPKATEMSYEFLKSEEKQILKMPNNILAIEYLKALRGLNSNIEPVSIRRKHISHNSESIFNNFTSSSYIRNNYLEDNIKNYMPNQSYDALINNQAVFLNDFFNIIKYKILENKIDYEKYIDYEIGMENRFRKYINSQNIYDFINKISTKRYTKSRITRLLIQIMLDLKKELIFESINKPYVRILASNRNGFTLLNDLKLKGVNYIDKFSLIEDMDDSSIIKKIAKKETFITNIYNIAAERTMNEDYLINKIVI
ncbi:hypothetical protein ING2D1G_0663 [Peptoniphilus sp. ING2-D1G]|nr:hypothetical protein ING2D1G_0663 [Peptoniphilus sp. ING2-D1G]